MNIQQLNQSGQNLWVFIVTGVIALLITGVSWFCVEVTTTYKGWPREGSTDDLNRNRSLAFRFALLVWLVKNGHTSWMWLSGAWLCILSNDKLGEFTAQGPSGVEGYFPEKACDYVYESISGDLAERFETTTWSKHSGEGSME